MRALKIISPYIYLIILIISSASRGRKCVAEKNGLAYWSITAYLGAIELC